MKIHSGSHRGDKTGARCKFCFAFGSQRREETGRIAKHSCHFNVLQVLKAFRPYYYLRHLRDNHDSKWNDFEKLIDAQEKPAFLAEMFHLLRLLLASLTALKFVELKSMPPKLMNFYLNISWSISLSVHVYGKIIQN